MSILFDPASKKPTRIRNPSWESFRLSYCLTLEITRRDNPISSNLTHTAILHGCRLATAGPDSESYAEVPRASGSTELKAFIALLDKLAGAILIIGDVNKGIRVICPEKWVE